MKLDKEIEKSINDIKTDGYRMSIGEVANLYRDGDLIIFPEYQRLFRWNETQKSDLIESIILGIPIPPIFVSQDEEGKWDIIDGLQRISTIMEFMGVLKDVDTGELIEPSKMISTKFLPSLQDKYWNNQNDQENSLSEIIRRKFKRAKLELVIIDSTNNPTAKYELFQRLNTNGSELTPQEIRNCIMVMIDRDFFTDVDEMSKNSTFNSIIDISDNQKKEQYEKDLITRYLVARNSNIEEINSQVDIKDFLTAQVIVLMDESNLNIDKEKTDFIEAIELLNKTLGNKVFKKYNSERDIHEGAFSLSIYEAILSGISQNLELWNSSNMLEEKIKSVYKEDDYINATNRGKRPVMRFKELTDFSKRFFSNED